MDLMTLWKSLVVKAAPKGAMKPGHKYIRRWWNPKSNRWEYEYYEAEHPDHHHGAAALIRRAGPGMVGVAIRYDPELKEKLKAMGGKWDPQNYHWVFPVQRFIERVRHRLEHEVYTEAAWKEIAPHLPEEELQESADSKAIAAAREAQEQSEVPRYPDGFPRPQDEERILAFLPTNARRTLKPDQIEDAVRIISRIRAARDPYAPLGVLLANGTGTGKTFVLGAVINEIRIHPEEYRHLGQDPKPVLVTVSKDLAAQTEEVLRDHFGLTRGVDYDIVTYADIRNSVKRAQLKGRPLIFDEAHKIKNMFGGRASQQAEGARELIMSAPFTIYSTATPFDRPWEAKYLDVAPFGRGIARALGAADFDHLMERYGVKAIKNRWGSKEYRFMGGVSDLKRFHRDLVRSGFMTQRYLAPEAPVEYAPEPVQIGEEDAVLLKELEARFSDAPGIVKALGTNLQRAVLERAKVKALIPIVRRELEQGRSVAVFFQFLRDHELKGDELIEALEEDENASSEAKREFARRLRGLEISLPSPVRLLGEAFQDLPGGVAHYTGNETQKKLREAKEAFNSGKTKLLLLTTAKGGTGLSFHDTVGNRPTTQIVVTLPWTAIELDQALGRAVRRGMRSDVRIIFPAAEAGVERKLALVIGERMRTLGYSVRGGAGAVPDEVLDAFTYGAAKIDPGAFRKRLEALEAAPLAPEPEGPATPEKTTSTPTPEAPKERKKEAPTPKPTPERKAEQIPLLPEPTLRTPLFPEAEATPPSRGKAKRTKPKEEKMKPKPHQTSILDDLPLFQLAKALGYVPGARLVVKAPPSGLVPVKKTVHRGGEVHQQTYYVKPGEEPKGKGAKGGKQKQEKEIPPLFAMMEEASKEPKPEPRGEEVSPKHTPTDSGAKRATEAGQGGAGANTPGELPASVVEALKKAEPLTAEIKELEKKLKKLQKNTKITLFTDDFDSIPLPQPPGAPDAEAEALILAALSSEDGGYISIAGKEPYAPLGRREEASHLVRNWNLVARNGEKHLRRILDNIGETIRHIDRRLEELRSARGKTYRDSIKEDIRYSLRDLAGHVENYNASLRALSVLSKYKPKDIEYFANARAERELKGRAEGVREAIGKLHRQIEPQLAEITDRLLGSESFLKRARDGIAGILADPRWDEASRGYLAAKAKWLLEGFERIEELAKRVKDRLGKIKDKGLGQTTPQEYADLMRDAWSLKKEIDNPAYGGTLSTIPGLEDAGKEAYELYNRMSQIPVWEAAGLAHWFQNATEALQGLASGRIIHGLKGEPSNADPFKAIHEYDARIAPILQNLEWNAVKKALGPLEKAKRVLAKAETRNIPVERLRWVDRPKERRELKEKGRVRYLLPNHPDGPKFPITNKDGSINCRLVRAAISRAAQHGYPEVERKARRIYERHCKKKEG